MLCLKAPARSKRRMAAELGGDATAAARHLLACALEDTRAWPGPVVLAPADGSDADWLARSGYGAHDVVVQRGRSLGERINHLDAVLRGRGFERLIYIGTDCPALDVGYLVAAHAALGRVDAVLGPASDGGVVLMGARRAWPCLADLPWSTPSLLAGLRTRLRRHRWTLAALGTLPDIDDAKALTAVPAQLAHDDRPARRALLAWLRTRGATRAEAS